MKKLISAAAVAVFLSVPASTVDASIGSACKKVGAVNAVTGLKCVNRKGKRVWEQFYSVPGRPSFILFTANNGSLTIGNPGVWGNPVATLFVIQMRSTAALDWVTVAETSIVNRSLTVSGLVPGVGYEIRVAAKNPYGTGEFVNSGLSYATGSAVATTTTTIGIGVGGQTTTTTTIRPTTTTSTTTTTTSTTTTTLGIPVSKSQAVKSAASYLRYMSFSRIGLIRQLEYEGFSNEDATYGVDRQNADWFAQAAKMAASYLRSSSFSRSGLINQLLYEGFSQAEAEYGVNSVGL